MRSIALAICLLFFAVWLAPGEVMGADVQQSGEGDFKRYCGSYEAYAEW
jgi:hypothetical protein